MRRALYTSASESHALLTTLVLSPSKNPWPTVASMSWKSLGGLINQGTCAISDSIALASRPFTFLTSAKKDRLLGA